MESPHGFTDLAVGMPLHVLLLLARIVMPTSFQR